MKMRSRILSFLLAVIMVAALIPMTFISVSAATVDTAYGLTDTAPTEPTGKGCGDGNHYSITKAVVETKLATCTEKGYDKAECVICGEKYVIAEYAATGHTLYSFVSADKFGTRCRDCSYSVTYPLTPKGTAFPSYQDMVNKVGTSNIVKEFYGNTTTLGAGGSLTEQGPNSIRFSTLTNVTEGGNTFARTEVASFNSIKDTLAPNSNAHFHYDVPSDTRSRLGASVVFEFDIKYPDTLAENQVNGSIDSIQGYSGSGSYTYGTVSIDKSGNIKLGSAVLGTVTNTKWTKIAIVSDFTDGICQVYIDGVEKGTFNITGHLNKGKNFVTAFRVNFGTSNYDSTAGTWSAGTRHADKNMVIELDNMYTYFADVPVYVTESSPSTPTGVLRIDYTGATKTVYKDSEGKSMLYQVGTGSTLTLNAKSYSEFTLIDTDADGVTDAMRFQRNPNVGTNSGTAGAGNDTHFTHFDGSGDKGINTIHLNLEFKEVTGTYTIIQHRFEKAEGGRADQDTLVYRYVDADTDYGSIQFFGKEIYRVYKGDKIDLYYVDKGCTGKKLVDIYINGKLYVQNYDYSYKACGNINLKQATYKMFNMGGNPTSAPVDIVFHALEVYNANVMPENYIGRYVRDTLLKGEVTNAVSFSENDSAAKTFGENNATVPGGNIFTAVEGKSYLALSKNPATAVPKANLRYVMLDKNGNEVTENGAWTMVASDPKTNGDPGSLLKFTKLNGLPVNADGSYNVLGYNQIRIRFYVKDTTETGYKFGIHAEVANGTGFSYAYLASGVFSTGWHEITVNLSPAPSFTRGGSYAALKLISFNLGGWNYGVHNDTPCTTTGCNNDDHHDFVDGISVYVESIDFIKKDTYLNNTSSTVAPYLCAEHTFGEATPYAKASCDTVGYSTSTCSVCGYVKADVTEEAGHNNVLLASESVAPNCEADGYDTYQCQTCQVKTKVFKSKTLHNFVLKSDATEAEGYLKATCIAGGQDVYVCSNENCNRSANTFVVATETDPSNHDSTGVTAWLEENGKHYQTCNCGAKINEGDHTYADPCDTECNCGYVREVPHNWKTTYEYENGQHWTVCADCGTEKPGSRADCAVGVFGTAANCQQGAKCGTCQNIFTDPDNTVHNYTSRNVDIAEHWMECECGAIDETTREAHNGTATCISAAFCTVCDIHYGDLDPDNHDDSYKYYFSNKDGTHTLYCSCGEEIETVDCSVGENGTAADCMNAAICGTCNRAFGEPDDNAHAPATEFSSNNDYHWYECTRCHEHLNEAEHTGEYQSENGYHWKECECGEVFSEGQCGGGEADCGNPAVCSECGNTYGDISAGGHRPDGIWVSDGTSHWQTCTVDGCGEKVYLEACSGGYATCTEFAVCAICENEYGDYADHVYDGDCDGVCNYCEDERTVTASHKYQNTCDATCDVCREGRTVTHTYKNDCDNTCDICFAQRTVGSHTGGTASCSKPAVCSSCGAPYGELTAHTYGTSYVFNAVKHWNECECGAKANEAFHTFTEANGTKTCTCGHTVTVMLPVAEEKDNNQIALSITLGAVVGFVGVGAIVTAFIIKRKKSA